MSNNSKYFKVMLIPAYFFLLYIVINVFIKDFSDIDITEMGSFLVRTLVVLLVILGVICFKNAFMVTEEGVNFTFNKIMAITFLFFSIICVVIGISLRASEEKIVKEKYNDVSQYNEDELIEYLENNQNAINELTKENDKFDSRMEDINSEIKKFPNTFERYLYIFINGGELPLGTRYYLGKSVYYRAYVWMAIISLYLSVFFVVNANPRKVFIDEEK